MRTKSLHRCSQTQRGPTGVRDGPLAVSEDLHVGTGGCESQLAEIPLKHSVDVDATVALSLSLLDVELGLFGDVERDILLWRRASRRRALLKVGGAGQNFDCEGSGLVGEDEGVIFPAELPESHASDNVVGGDGAQGGLVVVQPDLSVCECHQHQRQVATLVDRHGLHALDRRWQIDGEVLLAFDVEGVNHLFHAAYDNAPVRLNHSDGKRVQLYWLPHHFPSLHSVHGAVAAGADDSVVDVVQPHYRYAYGRRRQSNRQQGVAPRWVQNNKISVFCPKNKLADRIILFMCLFDGCHACYDGSLFQRD
mmetsp:Transcript_22421/g.52284  ORF Transcript_22421/g.52284 Transcript_22421/m.52284 type:complete len:308 (+) Transcript_22421:324-1247(+)